MLQWNIDKKISINIISSIFKFALNKNFLPNQVSSIFFISLSIYLTILRSLSLQFSVSFFPITWYNFFLGFSTYVSSFDDGTTGKKSFSQRGLFHSRLVRWVVTRTRNTSLHLLICVRVKRLITWFLVDRMLVVGFETTKAHRFTASRFILRVSLAQHVFW